jgi:hypothetical protein
LIRISRAGNIFTFLGTISQYVVDKPERLSENYRRSMLYNSSVYDFTGMINNIYINQMIKNNRKIIEGDECGLPQAVPAGKANDFPIAKKNKIINDDEACEEAGTECKNNINTARVVYKINKNVKVIHDDEEEKRNELEDNINNLCEKVKNDYLKLIQQDNNINLSKEALKKYGDFNENGRRVKFKQDKENLDLNEYMPSPKKNLKEIDEKHR